MEEAEDEVWFKCMRCGVERWRLTKEEQCKPSEGEQEMQRGMESTNNVSKRVGMLK